MKKYSFGNGSYYSYPADRSVFYHFAKGDYYLPDVASIFQRYHMNGKLVFEGNALKRIMPACRSKSFVAFEPDRIITNKKIIDMKDNEIDIGFYYVETLTRYGTQHYELKTANNDIAETYHVLCGYGLIFVREDGSK